MNRVKQWFSFNSHHTRSNENIKQVFHTLQVTMGVNLPQTVQPASSILWGLVFAQKPVITASKSSRDKGKGGKQGKGWSAAIGTLLLFFLFLTFFSFNFCFLITLVNLRENTDLYNVQLTQLWYLKWSGMSLLGIWEPIEIWWIWVILFTDWIGTCEMRSNNKMFAWKEFLSTG